MVLRFVLATLAFLIGEGHIHFAVDEESLYVAQGNGSSVGRGLVERVTEFRLQRGKKKLDQEWVVRYRVEVELFQTVVEF